MQEAKEHVINDVQLQKTVRAGVIQCFEYTFEVLWKLLKHIADDELLFANSPKSAFKAAFKLGLIDQNHEEVFNNILLKRNLTTHTYNELVAQDIYSFIKVDALEAFDFIKQKITDYLG